MPDVPAISVLMPAFNAKRYVREAVGSILAQTFGDFELIVVDDGSTDGTSDLVQQFAARDVRIRVLKGSNEGVSRALNRGLAVARGEFIARMDADDVAAPERFELQVAFLRSHSDYVLVGSRCMLTDPDGFPICQKPDVVLDHEEIDAALMRMSWSIVHPAVMIRTDAIRKIGGYDPSYRTNQDHDLFLRLAEVGRLANLPQVLLNYRQHFQSVGARKLSTQESGSTVVEIVKAAHARRSIPFEEPTPGEPMVLRPIDYRRNWWWWSLQAGNLATARRQALAMLRDAPWSGESWRAVYCAVRGH